MERKRQRELVAGVAAVAVLAFAVVRIRNFNGELPAAPFSRTAPKKAAPAPVGQVPIVDLDALKADPPGPVESPRNPFRFKPTPPPAPVSTQTRVPPPPINTGPVEPPPPPRIPLKFIGTMEAPKTGLLGIFSDGRGAPFYGKQGDVIDGRYRIVRIGVESVDLAYLDGRGRQTIRQTGQ